MAEESDKKVGYDKDGYTFLPDVTKKKFEQVKRKLPDWLADPDVVEADISNKKKPLEELKHLFCDRIYQLLLSNSITHLFPVQWQVIPAILDSLTPGSIASRAGLPPRDICCSAPTGSGKTLAFVLPIVQALQHRVVCKIRALIVLPVSDLAMQIYHVFLTYTHGTKLKVGLTIGQSSLAVEQNSITKPSGMTADSMESTVDILISTPGRLIDHINMTKGFDLSQLRYLVLDEVDRTLEEVKHDWLNCLERAVYSSRGQPKPITASCLDSTDLPLQKLLFSATLTENPEKLELLNLCQPRLFTSLMESDKSETKVSKPEPKTNKRQDEDESEEQFLGKYTTPGGLKEYYVECKMALHRPLTLLYLLHTLKLRRVLVFTGSQRQSERVYSLLTKFGDGLTVEQLSGALIKRDRVHILKQFCSGDIDVLVSTDVMARGIDVSDVTAVISYSPPPYIKTYIHRVGRTARAGKEGVAYTIAMSNQVLPFKKMLSQANKTAKPKHISRANFKPYMTRCRQLLGIGGRL